MIKAPAGASVARNPVPAGIPLPEGPLHPFAPRDQWQGYREMCDQLEQWLAEITGFAAVSLQPNAGSQGEYAGLLAIRAVIVARRH